MTTSYIFKKELLNILIKHINLNGITAYSINLNEKYTINYIYQIIIKISTQYYLKYMLPTDLSAYFNKSSNCKLKPSIIKNLLKSEYYIANNDSFLKTYVVIDHDIHKPIKELTVFI